MRYVIDLAHPICGPCFKVKVIGESRRHPERQPADHNFLDAVRCLEILQNYMLTSHGCTSEENPGSGPVDTQTEIKLTWFIFKFITLHVHTSVFTKTIWR